MTDKTYNGWTNWETRIANLHWANNFEEQAQEAWDQSEADTTFSREENAAFDLAKTIEATMEEGMDEMVSSDNPWINDILTGYHQSINFHEIAKAYISNLDKEQAA